MIIDTRFLTVHPRTVLWWEQREKCRRCKHYDHVVGNSRIGGQEACTATPARVVNSFGLSCISAREPGERCGPEAKLFKAAA